MATKKATKSAGPERVDSKSFNGARRATVLRKHTTPRETDARERGPVSAVRATR